MTSDNRRVISATCTKHAGARGFTNLVVTRRDGYVELDPHAIGACVVRLDESGARDLCETLTEWFAEPDGGTRWRRALSMLFVPLLGTNPAVRGRRGRPGRPRRRPEKLYADKGYDYRCRTYLHQRGIKVRIARRGMRPSHHQMGCAASKPAGHQSAMRKCTILT